MFSILWHNSYKQDQLSIQRGMYMEGLYKKQEIEQSLKIEIPTLNFWK